MKTKIFAIEKNLFPDEVRAYCIKNKMYTQGNNAEYAQMLRLAENTRTDSDIIAVMRDIWNHSNNAEYEAEGGTFSSFAYDFMSDCVHLFITE